MYEILESNKPFEIAAQDLESAVKAHGFGILHIHDLGTTLRDKGFDFEPSCQVFEICNPAQAENVMAIDMRLNMALPCRISVYTEAGKVKIGYIKPAEMLSGLSKDPSLNQIAYEVEAAMKDIISDAV